jgi:dipeptidyl-peptidase-4
VVPGRIRYAPDSRSLTFLFSERGDLARDLWRLDLASGRRERMLEPPEATRDEGTLSLEEALRRERLRIRETGITDYWWAEEAPVMLVPIAGDLYRWSDGRLTRLTAGAMYPTITRGGQTVFFCRDGEVWCIDASGEHRLTSGAEPGISNGLAEFVAQEELDREMGYWVSRDGRWLAFEQVDERNVPLYPIVHQGEDGIQVEQHRYPFAGAENVRFRLGVMPVSGGSARWLELGDSNSCYLARAQWHPDGRLLVQVLRRDWQHLQLVAFDPATGNRTTVLEESGQPWINLHHDLHVVEQTGEFTWSSERDGFRHLSLHAANGRLVRRLTSGDWPVDGLLDVDGKGRQLYFAAGKDSPLERQVYRVSLDGGEPVALTHGAGMHSAVFAPDGTSFTEYFDSLEQPPSVVVRRPDGELIHTLHAPAEVELPLRPPELRSFRADDGTTLYAALYHPAAKKGQKAPVIVEVYGGPGPQSVNNSWAQTVDLRAQMLAEHGFLVVKVDNRGSARRGLRFEGAIARNFGDLEVREQVAGVRWLRELGLADPDRAGIYGWSYGGYMAAMALLKAGEIFSVGVAGAPVADWDGYDTAYTEKYMSTPQDNPEGYRQSSLLTHAERLRGHLLLVHGLIDENVHFRHTARFMNALIKANRPYDVLLYPSERHMPRSEKDRVAMETRILEYFETHLQSPAGS